ncbi:acyl carrier protein [Sorangium sp. So ce887]|uniref:acyl carrier protein n=1 Tax=Sorangium sp. So ce887 TaxID=3133324 RepID=UPI003F5DFC88
MNAASQEELMEEIKNTVKAFILSHILPGESPANLKDDTPLRSSGILDSISTLRLIQFVESRFEIEVSIGDANSSNFDSIDSVAAYVAAKKATT